MLINVLCTIDTEVKNLNNIIIIIVNNSMKTCRRITFSRNSSERAILFFRLIKPINVEVSREDLRYFKLVLELQWEGVLNRYLNCSTVSLEGVCEISRTTRRMRMLKTNKEKRKKERIQINSCRFYNCCLSFSSFSVASSTISSHKVPSTPWNTLNPTISKDKHSCSESSTLCPILLSKK